MFKNFFKNIFILILFFSQINADTWQEGGCNTKKYADSKAECERLCGNCSSVKWWPSSKLCQCNNCDFTYYS